MMTDVNPYAAPHSQTPKPKPTFDDGPKGLGGWLILVIIGVVLSPIRIIIFSAITFVPLFQDGTWTSLTSPESELYSPYWAPILLFEIGGNIFFAIAYIFLAYLLFTKSRLFPRCYIALAALNLVFMVVDAVGVSAAFPEIPLFEPDSTREIVRGVVSCGIWIPYMLVSKRVQNTFVR